MKLKKAVVAAVSLASLVSLTGCKKPANALTVCIASEPQSIDPALNSAVDGATLLVHLNAGLYRWVEKTKGGSLELAYDLAESITKAKQSVVDKEVKSKDADGNPTEWEDKTYPDGTRYTVKLREGLKWSNGDKLTSDDFIWSWNRACGKELGADYGYMFEPICGYTYNNLVGENSLGLNKVDDRTFTIDVMVDVPYFEQLLAFPTFFPVNRKTVEKNDKKEPGTWATKPRTYVSCGAYTLSKWKHNSSIVLKKNPKFWNAENVTAEQLTFALSDDDNAILASYNSGAYDMIDTVPNDQIDNLKKTKKDEFVIAGQMGTYYVSFNVNSTKFDAKANTEEKRANVRKALGLLIDRQHIVKDIGKAGQIPANAFVSAGLSDPEGGEFVDHNGENGDGKGYYSKGETDEEFQANRQEAINLLKEVGYTFDEGTKKFTDFPSGAVYLYNESSGHKLIGEYLKDEFESVGINIELQSEVWASFLTTRKEGNYDIARNGWLADYDDPSSYLSMWTSASGNNDSQFGRGRHADAAIYEADLNNNGTIEDNEKNLTWAQSYDVLNANAAKETDSKKRFKILHNQETLLMSTGAICPLYFYTDLYLIKSNIKGFYSSPLGYKYFLYCTVE